MRTTLHYIEYSVSERWEYVFELNTIPIENNYLYVSAHEIKSLTLMDHIGNVESHERNLKQ